MKETNKALLKLFMFYMLVIPIRRLLHSPDIFSRIKYYDFNVIFWIMPFLIGITGSYAIKYGLLRMKNDTNEEITAWSMLIPTGILLFMTLLLFFSPEKFSVESFILYPLSYMIIGALCEPEIIKLENSKNNKGAQK